MLRLASCGLLHRVRASSSSFNSYSTSRRIAAPVLYTKPQVLFRQSCYQTTTTMPLERSTAPLVWIDCEMTGLDSETDSILQICCFITDAHLRLLEPTGFETTIHHPKHILDKMSPWCVDTHGRTGLTAAVLASTTTPEAAATDLLSYIRKYVPQPRMAVLAGNSVHADKAFLARGPYAAVLDWLHYRILDVSAIKEAARRWGSEELLRAVPAKKEVHLAKDDILESIDEMRFYKERLFGEQPTHSQE